MKLKNPKYQ